MSELRRSEGPIGAAGVNQKHSKRRTSKVFLLVNTALAWGLAFYGIHSGQAASVVASALALIGALYGAYTGIGHLDYRRFLAFFNNQQEPFNADAVAYQTLEVGGPDDGDYGAHRIGFRSLPEGQGGGRA